MLGSFVIASLSRRSNLSVQPIHVERLILHANMDFVVVYPSFMSNGW
jgi:hypothetical protein